MRLPITNGLTVLILFKIALSDAIVAVVGQVGHGFSDVGIELKNDDDDKRGSGAVNYFVLIFHRSHRLYVCHQSKSRTNPY